MGALVVDVSRIEVKETSEDGIRWCTTPCRQLNENANEDTVSWFVRAGPSCERDREKLVAVHFIIIIFFLNRRRKYK